MKNAEVVSYKPGGSSSPIILRKDDVTYFVKLRKSVSGEHALLCEWFANSVGHALGINTQIPQWITLTVDLKFENIPFEIRNLVTQSLGINLAFPYLDNAIEIQHSEIATFDIDEISDAFLLDLFMINIDRTDKNNNLMEVNRKVVFADFDSCLFFNQMMGDITFLENEKILQGLKSNPLYQKEIHPAKLDRFIEKLSKISFDEILEDVPVDILATSRKEEMKNDLQIRASRNWDLSKMLVRLESTVLESPAKQKQRTHQNRDWIRNLLNEKN